MATQKHNTYYNENTPDSGLYYYNENGEPKKVDVGSTYSAGTGIKIENDIISVSGKYVAYAGSALDGKQLVLKDNKWEELVLPPSSNWLPTIIEASANAYNSAVDWTTSQGYLTAHQIIPSAKWENASDAVESNSSKWNDCYTTLKTNSADWLKEDDITPLATKEELNTVSSTLNTNKLDKSVFDEYKDFVDDVLDKKQDKSAMSAYALSSWVDENYQKKGDYLSANALDLISETSGKWNEVSSKLDVDDFNEWSANADIDQYTGIDPIVVKDHKIYLSANYLSANSIDEIRETSANWNSVYETVNTTSSDWNEVSSKANQLDLEDLSGKVETLSGELESTSSFLDDAIDVVSAEFEKVVYTSATDNWDVTPYSAGKNINITNHTISVSGLHNTALTSTDDSVGITATTDASGNIQYDLGVNTIPGISGINGVSAYYDENTDQYIVDLEKNDLGFAKFSTSANIFTTSAVANGYNEDLNVNPTKITFDNDQILLKTGFYHIDVQTNFNITSADNNYYDVLIKSIPNAASITQMIDGSYAHTETVDLSFDVRITEDDTPIEISVENYKANETFAITNLNIHEIVSMPSQIKGGTGDYQAGDGITITNDTIAAKLGNGLEFNESNAIQVKLGSGLKFDESQGVQSIAIDNEVEDVVESVNKLQEDLDTKITDNFPPAMITLADLQVAYGTNYAPSNGGMLIGYLFTCPMSHKIYSNTNNDYQTKIGIYTKQWSGDNKKVILGIYEYDPDYINPDTQQVGTTRALCDTGIIDLQQGYAEYEIKNLGMDYETHEMIPGKFYYATIYLSYLAGDRNGITLFGAPGYNTQVNALKPGITITNVDKITASLYEGLNGYSPNLNFDQMGFSWQYESYPPDETTQYNSQDIKEANAAGRPYFAIRNIKK